MWLLLQLTRQNNIASRQNNFTIRNPTSARNRTPSCKARSLAGSSEGSPSSSLSSRVSSSTSNAGENPSHKSSHSRRPRPSWLSRSRLIWILSLDREMSISFKISSQTKCWRRWPYRMPKYSPCPLWMTQQPTCRTILLSRSSQMRRRTLWRPLIMVPNDYKHIYCYIFHRS